MYLPLHMHKARIHAESNLHPLAFTHGIYTQTWGINIYMQAALYATGFSITQLIKGYIYITGLWLTYYSITLMHIDNLNNSYAWLSFASGSYIMEFCLSLSTWT